MTKPTPSPTPGQAGSREAHTPGLLHTLGTQLIGRAGKRHQYVADVSRDNGLILAQANADRLAAAWNALDGLSTTAVSTLKPGAIARMLSEREELLAAAKKTLAFIRDLSQSNPGFLGNLVFQDYAQWNEAMIELPRAIARAEKEGA